MKHKIKRKVTKIKIIVAVALFIKKVIKIKVIPIQKIMFNRGKLS